MSTRNIMIAIFCMNIFACAAAGEGKKYNNVQSRNQKWLNEVLENKEDDKKSFVSFVVARKCSESLPTMVSVSWTAQKTESEEMPRGPLRSSPKYSSSLSPQAKL